MCQRWSSGVVIAIVAAVAVASGFVAPLAAPRTAERASTEVELTFSLMPVALEVRAGAFALEIKI